MATTPAQTPAVVEYGSPDVANAADVPPITQEEVISAGAVPDKEKRKTSDEAKKATDELTKAVEATKDAKAPAKKRKTTRKKATNPPPPSSEARYYYDIQNLIVADPSHLERLGLGGLAHHPIVTPVGIGGQRISAGAPVMTAPPPVPIKKEPAESVTRTSQSGIPVPVGTVFCPDCGKRIKRHTVEHDEPEPGNHVFMYLCPSDD